MYTGLVIYTFFHCVYKFFDNATVAGLIVLFFGFLAGRSIYGRQKDIDRKYDAEDKMSEALMLLLQRCASVNQTLDRLANTWILINAEPDENEKQTRKAMFFETSFKPETEAMTKVLMYSIPEEISKVQGVEAIYFEENEVIKEELKNVFAELKTWHDFVTDYILGKVEGSANPIGSRVEQVAGLSLDKLGDAVKKLLKNFRRK